VAEKLGLRIHSVMRGWAEFNSADANKVTATIEETAAHLRMAGIMGADAVLTVPCRVGGMTLSQSKEPTTRNEAGRACEGQSRGGRRTWFNSAGSVGSRYRVR
jgi:hypothetical protein